MDILYTQDEIISAIQSGSEEMHYYLYNLFYRKGTAFILLINKRLDAVDIYQDSMTELFRVIKNGKNFQKTIEAYLMGIIRNKSLKVLAENDWKVVTQAIAIHHLEIEDSSQEDLKSELMDIVNQTVEKMDLKCKNCLLLKYYSNVNIEDIAQSLGLAYNTVKGDLFACRKKLRTLVLSDPRVKEIIKYKRIN
jgi:RNA polymerase sigma factor (sigma-70 family)